MTPVSVLVVIVNYRTPALALEAVASLEAQVRAHGDAHVVLVDNGSADGSAEAMRHGLAARDIRDWCTLLPVDRNGGFAAGNNAALHWYRDAAGALPEFVWHLNPDARAHAGALAALTRFMAAQPAAGIAGSLCLYEDGGVQPSGFHFHSPRTELVAAINFGPVTRLLGGELTVPPGSAPARVDWVSGSSFMVRRAVFDAIGMMDEGFFLYFEECDFSARAAAAGFETWTVPASVVTHLGGQSTGQSGAAEYVNRRPRYWFAARARFFRRRYGVAGAHLANWLWLLGHPFGTAISRLRGRRRAEPPQLWRDFLTQYYGRGGLMYRLGAADPSPGGH